MKRSLMAGFAMTAIALLFFQAQAGATKYKGVQVIDKETLVVRFQDGDIR